MKHCTFTITISGMGETVEDCWEDACGGFSNDFGSAPSTKLVYDPILGKVENPERLSEYYTEEAEKS